MLNLSPIFLGLLLLLSVVTKAQNGIKISYAIKFVESETSTLLVKMFKKDNIPFLIEDSQINLSIQDESAFSSLHLSKYALSKSDSSVMRIMIGRDYWQDSSASYSLVKANPMVPEDFISVTALRGQEGALTPWIIHEDSKMIGNYLCFKATCLEIKGEGAKALANGQPIVAWFCPELPYAFGPLQFGGLPGLIVELQTVNALFGIQKIGFAEKIELPVMPAIKQILRGTNVSIGSEKVKDLYR